MVSTNSPKAKQDTSKLPRALTQCEFDSMMQEMDSAGRWMQNQLKQRKKPRQESTLEM